MINHCFVYSKDLIDGHIKDIVESISPEFLQTSEGDLIFTENVEIQGQIYIASDNLILNLHLSTVVQVPCSICNRTVNVEIKIEDLYHSFTLSDIEEGVFDILPVVREDILIEIPQFSECNFGNCPERREIEHYIKKIKKRDILRDEDSPFKDLSLPDEQGD